MSCRKPVGIFGGTFDPFHLGHLAALRNFASKFDFEKILVVPTGIPPHKMRHSRVSAEDRVAMVRLGISSLPLAEVWDYEIRHAGKSYSYLTLQQAARLYPGCGLVFFTGSDMFLTLHAWKRPEIILSLAEIAVFSRTGDDFSALSAQKEFLETTYGAKCLLFSEKPVAVSSTSVREELKKNGTSEYLPAAVGNYIREKGLYLSD